MSVRKNAGARVLLVGLDGADPGLVEAWARAGELPVLAELVATGRCGSPRAFPLTSTLPAWTSVLTGASPGRHGVLDFTVRHGYGVRFVGGATRALPTLVRHLDEQGLTAALLGFPGTFPPEQLVRSVAISGWDSPVSSALGEGFVEPPWLHRRLVASVGARALALDAAGLDEHRPDRTGMAELGRILAESLRRRATLAYFLLGRLRFDLLAVYFGETDTAAHHLWPGHDPGSPRRPKGFCPPARDPLLEVYRAADEVIGELVDRARPEAVIVVSDHGSGGASDTVLHLNRWLARAGLQRRGSSVCAGALARAREVAPALLPQPLREPLFRQLGRALPNLVESWTRLGGIDFRRTVAFSEEIPYAPSVWLNVAGREPRGVVDPGRREATASMVARQIESELRDPWTGAAVVRRAWLREEVLAGPAVARAPDILLELELDRGYSYALLPSNRGCDAEGPFVKLADAELLGRKGRALSGSHRPDAFLALSGRSVGAGRLESVALEDVAPTVCAMLGIPGPPGCEGRALVPGEGEPDASRDLQPSATAGSPANAAILRDRLRRLGYVD